MKVLGSRFLAAAAALALTAQSTGAASLPAALMAPAAAFPRPVNLGAFPAARRAPAAAPKAATPRETWLDSAKVVAAYVFARIQEESTPVAAAVAEPAPAPVETPEVRVVAPPAAPPADRMMIVMTPGERVEEVLGAAREFTQAKTPVNRPLPTLPPFRERWIAQGGVRARLSYLHAHGLVKGDARGYTAEYPGTTPRRWNRSVPKPYRRAFPIFFHDESVEMEVTVENTTDHVLRGVTLEAGQETFRPVGTEGARLTPTERLKVAESLAPGARATVRWRALLRGPAVEAVNLEQTHVRVSAQGRAAPLLDAPQAGAVDPPGPGML